jgi:hypothetical protein
MDNRMTARPDVAAWIADYRPRGWAATGWDAGAEVFVRAGLAAIGPQTIHAARMHALVLSRLAGWCLAEGVPLDVEVALDPDTVERFIIAASSPQRSRATYRSTLRRLGRALTKSAPWEPRPAVLDRRHIARPYSASELEALRRDAGRQSTPGRARAGRALIALGAGAGLDARWALDVRAADVEMSAGAVSVGVGQPMPRRVVVLAEFENDIADLAEVAADGLPLVGSTVTGRNRANKLAASIELAASTPRLSLSRLRATWLTTHLRLGTRLPELARAAGLVGITVLSDLLAEIEPLDDADAVRMLRGVR